MKQEIKEQSEALKETVKAAVEKFINETGLWNTEVIARIAEEEVPAKGTRTYVDVIVISKF